MAETLRSWHLAVVKWVLFYDGECGICTSSVNRVFALDQNGVIDFSPLQGEFSRANGLEKHADIREGTMVVLRESDGAIFLRTDAILEIARALGGIYKVATVCRWIPRFLRDGAYKWFARNRHHFGWVGNACRIPSPEFLARIRP